MCLQVSLRDAIRSGMQELDLQQVISDAVSGYAFCPGTICVILLHCTFDDILEFSTIISSTLLKNLGRDVEMLRHLHNQADLLIGR